MKLGLVAFVLIAAIALVIVSTQTGEQQVSLVVTNGTVVTMDAGGRVIENGAVAVDGADIVAVDTADAIQRQFRGTEIVDAAGQVVMPGLINTHTHAPMVLFRGLADDLALMDWLTKYIFPAEAKTVSPEFVRVGTRLAALEMIQSGTTTYADMYYFEEEIAKETKAAGLRGVLGQTVIQFPVADAKTPADALARAEAFIMSFKGDPLITPAVAPHAMYTLDGPTLMAARQLAMRHGVPTLIHLAETRDEVKTAQDRYKASPVGYLDSIGFLGPGVVAAHGVWVSEPEIATLRQRGVGVSHNPESNMKLASGTAPVPAYLRRVSHSVLAPTGPRATTIWTCSTRCDGVAAAQAADRRPAGRQREDGARDGDNRRRACARHGRPRRVPGGGKRADIIVVGHESARQTPMYDPISHLVYATRGDDVRTTIVQGKVLMKDRKVLTLNEASVLTDASPRLGPKSPCRDPIEAGHAQMFSMTAI